jgi:hypothetical protein
VAVRRLIEKVTVYEDKYIVEFKPGVTGYVKKNRLIFDQKINRLHKNSINQTSQICLTEVGGGISGISPPSCSTSTLRGNDVQPVRSSFPHQWGLGI